MQTFVPYNNFQNIVECLDYRRLGKMRVESRQLYNAITGVTINGRLSQWRHHSVALAWKGCEDALMMYSNYCILEWVRRGHNNTMPIHPIGIDVSTVKLPFWWNGEVHSVHRAVLLGKNYDWYKQFEWLESPNPNDWWKQNRKLITVMLS